MTLTSIKRVRKETETFDQRVANQGNNQILPTLSLTIYYNQHGNKFGTNFSSYIYTIKGGPPLDVSLNERKAKNA